MNDLDTSPISELSSPDEASQGKTERLSVSAYRITDLSIAGFLSFFWLINPYEKPLSTLIFATAVFVMGFFPLRQWTKREDREHIPILELHAFFYAICFGLGGFIDPIIRSSALLVSENELQVALILTLLGLASLYTAYFIIGPKLLAIEPMVRWPFVFQQPAYSGITFFLYPFFLAVNLLINKENIKALDQIAEAATTFLFIFLLHAYLSNLLAGRSKIFFKWIILPFNLIFLSGLTNSQIAGFVGLCILIVIIYMSGKNKIPYRWVALGAVIFFLLQPIKWQFRSLVWEQEVPLSPTEKLQTFGALGLNYYLGEESYPGGRSGGLEITFQRINHLHVTAAIIADTPERQPYLYGKTYLPLFTKWIPRFIWPDKPLEDLGNRWAIEYGYLNPLDYVTSFNLPWLPEMYMNFGIFGIVFVNFLIGLLFRYLSEMFWWRPENSSSFAFGLTLGAPLMMVESHLSMKLGSIMITTITLLLLMIVLNMILPTWMAWDRSKRISN